MASPIGSSYPLQDRIVPFWDDYRTIIEGLKQECPEPHEYYEESWISIRAEHLENRLFMGSLGLLSITSRQMSHDSPGCLAAPEIHLTAKHSISLGTQSPSLLRIFAPTNFVVTTHHLLVGRIDILAPPELGLISCKKLTLLRNEINSSYELLQSMLLNDDVDLEFVNQMDPTEVGNR